MEYFQNVLQKPRLVQDNREVDRNAKPELDVKRQDTIVISAKQSEEDVENNFFRYSMKQTLRSV